MGGNNGLKPVDSSDELIVHAFLFSDLFSDLSGLSSPFNAWLTGYSHTNHKGIFFSFHFGFNADLVLHSPARCEALQSWGIHLVGTACSLRKATTSEGPKITRRWS
jgi:hypothetical protein